MVNGLAASGFSPEQTEQLARLFDQAFTRQEAFQERLLQDLKAFREESRQDLRNVRDDLSADIRDLRSDLRDVRSDVRDMRGDIREVRRWTVMTLTALVLLLLGSILSGVT